MKLLEINVNCGAGSTGRITADIAAAALKTGIDACVAYGREYRETGVPSFRFGSRADFLAHTALARLTDRAGFYSRSATRRLIDYIESYNPDVIHLHNLHGYFVNIDLLFSALAARCCPVIWTMHDCWAFTGHCSNFDYVGCTRWREGGCRDCPQKNMYPASYLADASARNFREKRGIFRRLPPERLSIVTPSEWLAGRVRESFMSDYPVTVIPNGIDLSVFRPTPSGFRARYGLENKKIILGVAGVWYGHKGLYDFIELSRLVSDEYRIVMVGVNDKEKKLLPGNIIAVSRTENAAQLAGIYTAADVFVNPSIEETMGMTTAEALACGTPVITYNRTAVPETADTSCGIAVSPSPENILAALPHAVFPAEACMRRAAAFEKQQQCGKYTALIRELGAGAPSGG